MENMTHARQRELLAVPFDLESWRNDGHKFRKLGGAFQWAVGDWIIAGLPHLAKIGGFDNYAYEEASRLTDFPVRALYNLVWMAKRFPPSLRREHELSYGHHKELARSSFNSTDIVILRDQAIANGWKIAELRSQIERYIADKDPARQKEQAALQAFLANPLGSVSASPATNGATITQTAPPPPIKEKRVTVTVEMGEGLKRFLKALGKARNNIPASWVVRRMVEAYVIPNKEALLEEIEQAKQKRKAEREAKKVAVTK